MRKIALSLFLFLVTVYTAGAQVADQQAQKKPQQKKNIVKKLSPQAKLKPRPHNNRSSRIAINGQWRGYFNSNGDIVSTGKDNTEYVLELDIQESVVSGYSYSYFQNRAYYVICSLEGQYDKATNKITIIESARIKGATPPGWDDCLQMHILTYHKQGNAETLTGSWKMAPGQLGDCGFGNTTLVRRTLQHDLASYNKTKSNTPFSAPKHINKTPETASNFKPRQPVTKVIPTPPPAVTEPITTTSTPAMQEVPNNAPQVAEAETPKAETSPASNFEKRNNELSQTVVISNETFRVDLYDNGIIDGDSVSLFYNGKLILAHQRLSDTAITVTLSANTKQPTNELIMYADNLGDIPPNTALMVVTDGENRYEVPVTSDLKNSGTIRFVFKPKSGTN